MSFLDSVKERLGAGSRAPGRAAQREWEDHDGEYYDDRDAQYNDQYDERYAQQYDDYGDGYDDNTYHSESAYDRQSLGSLSTSRSSRSSSASHSSRPTAMNRFGVDRADYYSDSNTPLVSLSDVRSAPLPLSAESQSPRSQRFADRSPDYGADYSASYNSDFGGRVNQSPYPSASMRRADEDAFKDGLARSSGSLVDLQQQRMRMEGAQRNSNLVEVSFNAGIDQSQAALGDTIDLHDRISTGQVFRRSTRSIQSLAPLSYGEAEQVSKALKEGVIVALDLRNTRPELAKRILDFSFGVASALDGQVQRHIDRVYIFNCGDAPSEAELQQLNI